MASKRSIKTRKIYDGPIPFNPVTGNMQAYPSNVPLGWFFKGTDDKYNGNHWGPDWAAVSGKVEFRNYEPRWDENRVFRGRMKLTGYGRGRSSAVFLVTAIDVEGYAPGTEFTMFISDFTEMVMKTPSPVAGEFEGTFTFCKQGSNYGMRSIQP